MATEAQKTVTLRNTTAQDVAILNPDTCREIVTMGRKGALSAYNAKGGKPETAPYPDTVEVSAAVAGRADVKALIAAGRIAVA